MNGKDKVFGVMLMKYVNSVSRVSQSIPTSTPPTFPGGVGGFKAANDNFVGGLTGAANDNRRTFNWVTARAKRGGIPWRVFRITPWVTAAIVGIEIAQIVFRKHTVPEQWNFTGYDLVANCGPWDHYSSAAGVTCPSSILPIGINGYNNWPVPRPSTINLWLYSSPSSNPAFYNAAEGQRWRRRTTSGPAVWTPPSSVPRAMPRPNAPALPTWVDPLPLPLINPAPVVPLAPPYRIIPDLNEDTNREVGPGPQPRPRPKPERPWPRPRRKEKKKRAKGKLNAALQFVKEGVYEVTEVIDAVECLWNAIPPWKKPKPWKRLGDFYNRADNPNARIVPMAQKMRFIMDNIDLIDWASEKDGKIRGALPCLMMNSIIDLGVGVTSGMAQSEAGKRKIILGLLG